MKSGRFNDIGADVSALHYLSCDWYPTELSARWNYSKTQNPLKIIELPNTTKFDSDVSTDLPPDGLRDVVGTSENI